MRIRDTAFQKRQRTQAYHVSDTRNNNSCSSAMYRAAAHSTTPITVNVCRELPQKNLNEGIKTDRSRNYYYYLA
jgi:hypothetical protein